MYIEKLGRSGRQIDSSLLQFAAEYYDIDYLKLRMSAKSANKLEGYRSFAVKCKTNSGETISSLLWFSDFEFGSTNDEAVNNDSYVKYMADNLGSISKQLSEQYLQDQYIFINNISNDGMGTN